MAQRLKSLFILSFLFSYFFSAAQFNQIDEAVKNIPRSKEKSIENITKYIQENSSSDLEKARGAYYWIANNIKYDVKKYLKDEPSNFQPEKVLKKRKAVCAGYSSLYMEMCRQMNIPCEIISGYSKDYGDKKNQQFNEADHAWNAIKIDSTWLLLDVTWASGHIKQGFFVKRFKREFEDKYFNPVPSEFIFDHLPEIPMWQLLNYPITVKLFSGDDNKIYEYLKKKKSPYFQFTDTIQSFYDKDTTQMSIEYGKMATRFNSNNTIPLAYSMLKIVERNIKARMYSAFSPINTIDSMIFLTENSIRLFKKAKSSRKSVKELLEENIVDGNEVLAKLYYLRALHFEKLIPAEGLLPFDSLKYIENQVTKSIITTINIYKTENKKKSLKETEEHFCSFTLNLYTTLIKTLDSESDVKKKKYIQKEISLLINLAKKNISEQCDCKQKIEDLKL